MAPTTTIVAESINPTTDQALTHRDTLNENEFLNTLDEEIRQTEESVKEMNARFDHIKRSQSPLASGRRGASGLNSSQRLRRGMAEPGANAQSNSKVGSEVPVYEANLFNMRQQRTV